MTIKNRFPLAVSYDSNNDPSGFAEFEPKTTDLSDIGDSTPSTGQVLTWTDDGKYQPQTPTGGGGGAVNSVNDLTGDVDLYVSSLSGLDLSNLGGAEGEGGGLLPQIIEWDGAASQWKATYEEQQFIRIKNNTGATLTKGQVVYAYGFQGDQALVGLAKADSSTTMPSIGIVYADILDTESGLAVSFGTADIDNTLTIEGSPTAGDTIYVSPNASGDLTSTKPTGISHLIQNVGILLKASPGAKIKVTGVGRSNDIPNTIALGPAGETTITSATAKFTGTTASQVVITNASNQISSQSIANIVGDVATGADLQDLSDVNGEDIIGDNRVGKIIQFQGTGIGAEWKLVTVAEATNYASNLPEGEDVPAITQIDHGILSGLGDDDHTQYVLSAGSRAMSALTVTNSITAATVSATNVSADGLCVNRVGQGRPTKYRWECDYLTPGTTQNGWGSHTNNGSPAGTGATIAGHFSDMINTVDYGVGVLEIRSGTGTNGRAMLTTYNNVFVPSSMAFNLSHRLTMQDLWSSGTNEGYVIVGIADNGGNATKPLRGLYFRYDETSPDWQAIATTAFSTETVSGTGVAVTEETFQVLQIIVDEDWTKAQYFIDGSLVATMTLADGHEIPQTGQMGLQIKIVNTLGGAGNDVWLDWHVYELSVNKVDRGEDYIKAGFV